MTNKTYDDLGATTTVDATDLVATYAPPSGPMKKIVATDFFGAAPWAIRALTPAADKGLYFTSASAAALMDFTSVGRTLVGQSTQALMRTAGLGMSDNGSSLVSAADYSAMRTLLSLVPGTDVQPYNAQLAAIAANSTNGFWARSGAGTGAARSMTGTASQIDVTNGDGVSGAPTVALLGNALALSNLSLIADRLPYANGTGTLALTNLVSQARSFLATPTTDYVTFLNSATGGVSRTAQSKLEDLDSVIDFGAVGNGSTDDTAAISASPAGTFFPAGKNYYLTSDIAGLGKYYVGFGGVKFSGPSFYRVQTSTAYGIGSLANNVGFNTGTPTLTDKNTGIGVRTLYNNTTGYHNTAVGDEALFTNIIGNQNTAVGMNCLYYCTGNNNTAIGVSCLLACTGDNNTAAGRAAGIALGAASYNTLMGRNCAWAKTNGDNDSYFGAEIAWLGATSLGDNTGVGYRACYNLSGQYNAVLGAEALYSATTATYCAVMGRRAAFNNTASEVTAIGGRALFSNTTGARVTALGNGAGYSNTTADDGTYLGWNAGYAATGPSCVFIGSGSGGGSGNGNTVVGAIAGNGLTSGSTNIFVGHAAGRTVTTGNNNLIIGYDTEPPASNANNQMVLQAGTTRFQMIGGTKVYLGITGTPEGVITAPIGSMATRADGTSGTIFYLKVTGTGNTGWVSIADYLSGSATYDAPSIAPVGTTTTTVTVTGAAVGDFAQCSFGVSLAGLMASAYVSAADTVTVVLYNPTAGAVDLASTTLRVRVQKQ